MRYDLVNMAYRVENNKPVIYLFCRDKHRKRKIIRVKDFKPFFYARAEDGDETDIFGFPIKRIETQLPRDVAIERKKYTFTCEADIRFPLRFIITKKIKCGFEVTPNGIKPADSMDVPPKILYFDIEVSSPPEIMPRTKDPRFPIVAISCSNNYNDDVVLFLLNVSEPPKPIQCGNKYITPIVYNFSNERMLLYKFLEWIVDFDPDILTGWNSHGFDFPYLFGRCQRLGVRYGTLSPFGAVSLREEKGRRPEVYIKGRIAIDLLRAYRKWKLGEQPTWDFKYIVKDETGFEYIDYGDQIEVLHGDKSKHQVLIEYCTYDAYACKLLDDVRGILPDLDELRRIVGCYFEDTLSPKKIFDTWLLRVTDKPLPTAVRYENPQKYKGAIVRYPVPGVHETVGFFDLKALYPTLFMTFNISTDTLDPEGEIIIGPWNEIVPWIRKDPGTVVSFKRSPEGIVPKGIRILYEQREYYREIRLKMSEDDPRFKSVFRKEIFFKWIAAAAYGVCAYSNFRLYTKDGRETGRILTASVTFLGRHSIENLIKHAESIGLDVLYGDTDGIYIKIPSKEYGIELEKQFNELLAEMAKEQHARYAPTIKYEHFFKRILFKKKTTKDEPAKKRYAACKEDDTLFLRGMGRRHAGTAYVTRETMQRWFELVLIEQKIKESCILLRKTYYSLTTLPINQVAIPKGLGKKSYEVRNPWFEGKKYSEKHFGWRFREDKKPMLIYVKGVKNKPPTEVICITDDIEKLPDSVIVDWKKMRNKVLTKKFTSLLDAIGLDWGTVFSNTKQSRLM